MTRKLEGADDFKVKAVWFKVKICPKFLAQQLYLVSTDEMQHISRPKKWVEITPTLMTLYVCGPVIPV